MKCGHGMVLIMYNSRQTEELLVRFLSPMSYSGGSPKFLQVRFPFQLSHYFTHRASDPVLRKKYVKLVESVRQKGAEVLIFSSMHESGQREYRGISSIVLTPCVFNI